LNELLTIRTGLDKGMLAAKVRPAVRAKAIRVGKQRRVFWSLMAATGLRHNEAKTLRLADLDLDAGCIHLQAGNTKNRQAARIPLRRDIAADLNLYLAERLAFDRREAERLSRPVPAMLAMDDRVFPDAPSWKVFENDRKASGIEKTDARGRVIDIHSLRATYASMLAAAGVPLATAQVLMRHSTPALTAKHYVDPQMLDTAGAVERLPGFSTGQRERQAAAEGALKGALRGAPDSGKRGQIASTSDNRAEKYPSDTEKHVDFTMANKNRRCQQVAPAGNAEKLVNGPGIEPGTCGLKVRCSTD
jgi:hypothetical protein